jgi:hypothetical protein
MMQTGDTIKTKSTTIHKSQVIHNQQTPQLQNKVAKEAKLSPNRGWLSST